MCTGRKPLTHPEACDRRQDRQYRLTHAIPHVNGLGFTTIRAYEITKNCVSISSSQPHINGEDAYMTYKPIHILSKCLYMAYRFACKS